MIRGVVAAIREAGFELPLSSHILCACSGGADSTALAVLLARYGRRVGTRITLLHVNHGWRGKESDADEAFVRRLAKKLGTEVVVHRLKEQPQDGESWEAHAREGRKAIFKRESRAYGNAPVLTAHTADDQAETRIWRFLTGSYATLGEGILSRHEVEVRPFLDFRRSEIVDFLREERQIWREDSTNADPRFLRARIRRELMPVIEEIFPGAVYSITREKSHLSRFQAKPKRKD